MEDYNKIAQKFAKKHNVKLTVAEDPDYDYHFEDDKEQRYIFTCTLSRNGNGYTFKFGQSIASGNTEPTLYDVLTCLQKYDVGSFEDFCSDFGYDTDSRKAERIYHAVCEEHEAMLEMFTEDELQLLAETVQ